MKLIEKLNADYASGKFNGGITVKVNHSNRGNTYSYFTSDGNFYESFGQATNAMKIFSDFIKANNIEVTEVRDKEPIWNDNWKSEHPLNPTEKAPSFKSKW